MGSRFPSHQLSNGLYVSGRPEQPKEKAPTMSSTAIPYTGGDIKKSGELGKMFDIPVDNTRPRKSGPITNAPTRTGSFGGSSVVAGASGRQRSHSGPLNKQGEPVKKSSGPQTGVAPLSRQNSGSLPPVLPTTGLITSGPISSGPLTSSGTPRKVSGPLDSTGVAKLQKTFIANNQAITKLNQQGNYSFKKSFPRNLFWRAVKGFVDRYPDAELRTAKDGQYVKVSGVVTCGNVPLQSSFLNVPRCVYSSTCLYEYRGWDSKAANSQHRRFSWGLRFAERHVVDFYISDFQSGLRALVKTGYGASVTTYVDESVVADVDTSKREVSAEFLKWLMERNLSIDGHVMHLKEGYVKEGSTVSVMGIVRRNHNVLMIVPPSEPFSTGCQWTSCIQPTTIEGIILRCDDSSSTDVIPV
ncbi:hypothetical protein M5K25_013357 [Dendrobium thyrsiflorum]|uniref:Ubiquitin-specific protease family C19-related protein n=1 Tax=Dendrobium thyrsiflorum TaxID=117978 RepID=A0ABD0UZW8_DENTH